MACIIAGGSHAVKRMNTAWKQNTNINKIKMQKRNKMILKMRHKEIIKIKTCKNGLTN